jgi:hypothetical protein
MILKETQYMVIQKVHSQREEKGSVSCNMNHGHLTPKLLLWNRKLPTCKSGIETLRTSHAHQLQVLQDEKCSTAATIVIRTTDGEMEWKSIAIRRLVDWNEWSVAVDKETIRINCTRSTQQHCERRSYLFIYLFIYLFSIWLGYYHYHGIIISLDDKVMYGWWMEEYSDWWLELWSSLSGCWRMIICEQLTWRIKCRNTSIRSLKA